MARPGPLTRRIHGLYARKAGIKAEPVAGRFFSFAIAAMGYAEAAATIPARTHKINGKTHE